jgi:hypothetical protein
MQALRAPIETCSDMFNNDIVDPAVCSISDVALAITQTIRSQYFNFTDFSVPFAIGQTYAAKPTVEVGWPWIIPVGTLWILGLILTLGTMWKAHGLPDTNMSLNPLNFILVDFDYDQAAGSAPELTTDEQVEEFADQTRVRLQLKNRKMSIIPGTLTVG